MADGSTGRTAIVGAGGCILRPGGWDGGGEGGIGSGGGRGGGVRG